MIQLSDQANTGNNMATAKRCCLCLLIINMSIWLFILSNYFSNHQKILLDNSFFYKSSLGTKLSNKSDKECDRLRYIASEMLNGSRVALPFATNKTRWKFHKTMNINLLSKKSLIWNYEKKYTNAIQDFINLHNNTKAKDIKRRKHFVTFADNCCEKSKMKAIMSAIYPGGFDRTKIYDMSSLSAGFKKRNSQILTESRGRGYWLWKPYIILKTLLESMADGDILMYQDAGAYLIGDSGPLLKLCEHSKYGILLFYLTFLEKHYTKRDAYVLMNMDYGHIYEMFQTLASFMLFEKNCMSLQFVMEWLAYALDPRLITDMENTLGKENLPGFREHRHDQSVLSLLSKKWAITVYRTPSQYGNKLGYLAGPYSQLMMHSRNRN